MNQAAWLARAALAVPDSPALAHGERIVRTYAGLHERVARLAGGMRTALGLEPGDRVAIVSKNSPAMLETMYAIWHSGLAAVPVNAKLHGAEVGWILEHSGARAAFVGADLETAVAGHAPESLGSLTVLDGPAFDTLSASDPLPLQHRAPDDLAWLFYTSGTTGRPKGAMISHRNLQAASFGYLADVDTVAPGQAILHSAPMSHGSGLYIMPHVCRMGLNVVPESGGFDPGEIARLLAAFPQTSMFAAPTMIKRLVEYGGDYPEGGFRTLVWGGAPMHVADIEAALDRLGPCLAQIYGQGESPMTISVLPKDIVADRNHPDWRARAASAGYANSAVEVAIDGSPPGPCAEAGEILVRGDAVISGYWNDPAATAKTLRNGWLHTGDVGAIDAHGYLTLMDRSKDVIISGGSNIYPREVEEVLQRHPDLAEVSVIGRPDPEWGEVVVAYYSGSVEPADLDRLCLDAIARFKRPKAYVRVDTLPKNNYGKILKTALRELDAEGRKPDDDPG